MEFHDGQVIETKLKGGRFYVDVHLKVEKNRIFFKFPYNKHLIREIKDCFEKRKWHGFDEVNPRKLWSVPITPRNIFQLRFLQGKYADLDPYARFDLSIEPALEKVKDYCELTNRPAYNHQIDMVAAGLTTKEFYWACEMGTGKTLAAFLLMEMSGLTDWYWVGPKSALRQTYYEMKKWSCKVTPTFYTYEGLKKLVENWPSGTPAPKGIIFDEAIKIKTPSAQRSIAAAHLANSVRKDHTDFYIGLMSGAPSPKSPVDFWHQAEVACPGFLREGNIHVFKERLAIVEQREQVQGAGTYPHLVTWRDDPSKCNVCGLLREDHGLYDPNHLDHAADHEFEPSINEVAKIFDRTKGLFTIKLKKDCLDLPPIVYDIIRVEPTPSILQAAKVIAAKATSALGCRQLLRELSDGFQYQGKDKERKTLHLPCPKYDVLTEQLDLHFDIARLNIYAGFTASIDRAIETCHKSQWSTIRVDGRGWLAQKPNGEVIHEDDPLEWYDSGEDRVAFVGQAGAAGMGLDLTASPTTLVLSNDFNANSRLQLVSRGHRIGMREDGGHIIDVFHLPSDEYILNNLDEKERLQTMTLTGLQQSLET